LPTPPRPASAICFILRRLLDFSHHPQLAQGLLYTGSEIAFEKDSPMSAFAGLDTSNLLVQAMKVREQNHRFIANNIANVDTPHYNPVELDFQKTLRSMVEGRGGVALRTSRPQHFDFETHRLDFERLAFLSKNDYNKVDLDDQITKLSQNTGEYTTYARLLSKKFEMTKTMLQSLAR
jgi:flagellar basal-body rod protein FlgB